MSKKPWKAQYRDGCSNTVVDGDGVAVATVHTRDAELIAAAPDLLAALRDLVKKIEWAFDSEIQGALDEEISEAEAAIAKAEGR